VSQQPSNFDRVMIVNDTPGEECRIAILDRGRLDALFSERVATATNVGNIYKGKVTNVEPAIQAAFVDFGEGQNGFLHVSDLHPRYFPGGDKTEKVGKKIPRRARPMMQDALRRGSEILVQVLKEGIGTKGPTLTSYLSIPGRLLVMMPGMDKVGVSRKVEDESQRKEMRKILDSLALPEGFGFIVRTAGFTATKTDLSRDVAYLTRLWKVMERRMNSVGAPCELYTESDLLLRTLRDVLDGSVQAIVVDSESALLRASTFLGVIAPRSSPPVRFYGGKAPIFHAFDVERQIELSHAREVPLPSGGALVFDQAEALVAIDVNSGKSRSARDSETNAYQTNCEAVEEICRQLRLRDLGGLVVCDMIDMRSAKHRKDIEERFNLAFKRDRARTTVLPVSDFGIVEITRQRMRPSLRKTHYSDCPTCGGHGEVRLPDSVAADALRRAGAILAHERIKRLELVVPVRVASSLLSSRRTQLAELEESFAKRIDVRISEAIAIDRFDVYAYDDRNADVEIDRLPALPMPTIGDLPTAAPPPAPEGEAEEDLGEESASRGRRRRRRKPGPADAAAIALAGGFEPLPEEDGDLVPGELGDEAEPEEGAKEFDQTSDASGPGEPGEGGGRRRRRRRRRRGGRGRGGEGAGPAGEFGEVAEAVPPPPVAPAPPVDEGPTRVHLLAKQFGVTSKDIIDRCVAEGLLTVKAAMSTVSGEDLARIRSWFAPPAPAAEVPTATSASTDEPADGEPLLGPDGEPRRRRRRRRRRGGRGRGRGPDGAPLAPPSGEVGADVAPLVETISDDHGARDDGEEEGDQEVGEGGEEDSDVEGSGTESGPDRANDGGEGGEGEPRRGRRRRRRRGRRGRGGREGADGGPSGMGEADRSTPPSPAPSAAPASGSGPTPPAAPPSSGGEAPRPRALYAGGRTRKISPAALRSDDR